MCHPWDWHVVYAIGDCDWIEYLIHDRYTSMIGLSTMLNIS